MATQRTTQNINSTHCLVMTEHGYVVARKRRGKAYTQNEKGDYIPLCGLADYAAWKYITQSMLIHVAPGVKVGDKIVLTPTEIWYVLDVSSTRTPEGQVIAMVGR